MMLEKLTITDMLTGLYNRRYFNQRIPKEIEKATRGVSEVTFICLDLDYFKKINDNFGHLRGDDALMQVGKVINRLCISPDHFAFRMGGEEFLIVIFGSNYDIYSFSEELRSKIEEITIKNEEKSISHILSTSIGVYSHVPSKFDDTMLYLEKSDSALYKAKQTGRNKVIFYNS